MNENERRKKLMKEGASMSESLPGVNTNDSIHQRTQTKPCGGGTKN